MNGEKPFVIGVCGPTGAGKSTLARLIAEQLNCKCISEPVPKRLLKALDKSLRRNSQVIQQEILESKMASYARVFGERHVVLDRIVAEDRDVFFELHRILGFLNESQVLELTRMSYDVERSLGFPNAILFVTANRTVLKSRMVDDGRPPWLVSSLDTQLSLYSAFFSALRTRHLIIDTSRIAIKDLLDIAKWIAESLVQEVSETAALGLFNDLRWIDKA